MGLSGQTLWGSDITAWEAEKGFGFPPSWPSQEEANAFKPDDYAVRLYIEEKNLQQQLSDITQKRALYLSAKLGMAVAATDYPSDWQREKYPNTFAVLCQGGLITQPKSSAKEAEDAARAFASAMRQNAEK